MCLVEAEARTRGDQGGWWLPHAVASEGLVRLWSAAEVAGVMAHSIDLKFKKDYIRKNQDL